MSIGIFSITLIFRSQEEKLSEHLQKVATLPDLNIKMEKLGKMVLYVMIEFPLPLKKLE